MIWTGVQYLFLLSFLHSISSFDQSLQSQYTCGDPRWKLNTNDSTWNFNMSLWELTNVFVRPGILTTANCPQCHTRQPFSWFYINASVIISPNESNSTKYLDDMYQSAMECTKDIDQKNGSRPPVFFNFPCVNSPHWKWVTDNQPLYSPPSSMNTYWQEPIDGPIQNVTRDILFVFNSWSATSFYHVMIETIFPLWVTVNKARNDLHYSTKNITFLNLSPTCRDEPHQVRVKPIIEKLFGSGTYDDTWGGISHSFSYEQAGYYKRMIYGFHYPFRPYRDHILSFNADLGLLFRRFTETMKSTYYTPGLSIKIDDKVYTFSKQQKQKDQQDQQDQQNITVTFIAGSHYDTKRNLQNISALKELFNSQNITFQSVHYGYDDLSSIEAQATFSSNVNILLGAEGAGFVQQIFMPYNSLLILLHTPRLTKERYGHVWANQWHEAVGQYLDNSVINVITTRLDQLTEENYRRIVDITIMGISMHQKIRKEQKYFSCLVKPIVELWNRSDGCLEYSERIFLNTSLYR